MEKESLMDKAMANFSMALFYKVGAWLFCFIMMGSTYSLIATWKFINLGAKFSGVAGILLNCLFITLFVYLYRTQPNPADVKQAELEMKDILEEMRYEEGK